MICFRTDNIDCVSPLTPSDYQDLAKVVEKSGAEKLYIYLDKNSPDTVKRLCELFPGVTVIVRLSESRGLCYDITFSPHTDNINMSGVGLCPGEVTRLHQLVSLSQSWTVRDALYLRDLGPEDWTELSVSLDTLDSVDSVVIDGWSAPPSDSLLETLWDKTEKELSVYGQDGQDYYILQE